MNIPILHTTISFNSGSSSHISANLKEGVFVNK